jgi:putative MATE family efflux protein
MDLRFFLLKKGVFMKKELDLGKEKISKLLLTFSIPCVISMLINSIYNIVDQIFIGKGVGIIGNAATNVIFPIVIICNALAGLIGNGAAANLSLRLGEGKKDEAKKSIGSSITLLFIVSFITVIIGELLLPVLVNLFGCTVNVYDSAITYGRIILLGSFFMISYTGLSSIIRADGSPKYSMVCLLVGAILNIILDPIFIFGFNMGVAGGALATIIGQIISFIIAIIYIPKIKSVNLEKKDFKLNKTIFKTLSLGLSSFITQMTVLALFVVMNNIMKIYAPSSKFGADIPLSVYGVISKLNSLYVSSILGISIGAQPIIGYNYGAGNYKRVKETLRKVITIGFIIGVIFNFMFMVFPKPIVSIFINKNSSDYALFIEFAIDFCRIFLMVCALNSFEMCSSIIIQSLGNVKKATAVSFARQIILFIPISLILCHFVGLYGALYAGPIADTICFIFVIFVFSSEYKKISKLENNSEIIEEQEEENKLSPLLNKKIVVTIAREYGSGGRYVGKLLADNLGIKFYDKEFISEVSKETGLSEEYIKANEQKHSNLGSSEYNNDDKLFIAESKTIKKIAKESCVIVGRCANYVLSGNKDVINIFLYSDEESKINRAVKYYNLDKNKAKKIIDKINKEREKHYNYYTGKKFYDPTNYDLMINVDILGTTKTAEYIKDFIIKK